MDGHWCNASDSAEFHTFTFATVLGLRVSRLHGSGAVTLMFVKSFRMVAGLIRVATPFKSTRRLPVGAVRRRKARTGCIS